MAKSSFFKAVADNKNKQSLASQSRTKRFEFFKSLLNTLPKPITILDVGGTQQFWEAMEFTDFDGINVVLLNLDHVQVKNKNFTSVKGNATHMPEFHDKQFDVVFSNSVIEHLFTKENQMKMATEVRRVGKNYFIQTPNYWFPIEPHFVFPFFQYLPINLRTRMLQRYRLGHVGTIKDPVRAKNIILEIKLLSAGEMKKMFPEAKLYKDRILGLTKSFVAYYFPKAS